MEQVDPTTNVAVATNVATNVAMATNVATNATNVAVATNVTKMNFSTNITKIVDNHSGHQNFGSYFSQHSPGDILWALRQGYKLRQ